jgi:hypothetical protein
MRERERERERESVNDIAMNLQKQLWLRCTTACFFTFRGAVFFSSASLSFLQSCKTLFARKYTLDTKKGSIVEGGTVFEAKFEYVLGAVIIVVPRYADWTPIVFHVMTVGQL